MKDERRKRIGKPVIDELTMCYIASDMLLTRLGSCNIAEVVELGEFSLCRIVGTHYEYKFTVRTLIDDMWEIVGSLQFGRYGELEPSNFIFFHIQNNVLYDEELFRQVMSLPDELSLYFNNITELDIAVDCSRNICAAIKRMILDKSLTPIINGKAIKNRTHTIKNLSFTYATTGNRLKVPTVTIKQSAAAYNKTDGVTVQAYDKVSEILDSSHKSYILDYYGKPKRLYRLEVRLFRKSIRHYCMAKEIQPTMDMVFNPDFLRGLFVYYLSSVIRFSSGRESIKWEEILRWEPLVTTGVPSA